MLTWILENTLMAGALAVIIGLLCRFNRSRPAFCHLLWLLVFAVLVMPPLPVAFAPGAELRTSMAELVLPLMPEGGEDLAAPPEQEEPLDASVALSAEQEAGSVGAPLMGGLELAPAGESGRLSSEFPTTWVILAWALGALLIALRMHSRILAFHRNVRLAPSASRELRRSVAAVARRLGTRAPEIRLLRGIGSPAVWCFGRPRLLWPSTAGPASSAACQPSLIAHELAHLVRKDHWVSRLEVLAVGLLWWNPLFWVIRSQVRYYAELSCDAWALWAYPKDRRAFAEALIDAQEKVAIAPVALQGLCATDTEFKDFEKRLNMIMKRQVSRGVSKGAAALAILATVLVLPGFSDKEKCKTAEHSCKKAVATVSLETLASSRKLAQKAEKLYLAKEYAKAVALYRKVLEIDPSHPNAHARLGFMQVTTGEYAEAIKHFEHEIAAGNSPEVATYNMACAASLSGDTKHAIKLLHKAVQRGFSNTKLMVKDPDLAAIRVFDEFGKAVELAKKAVQLRAETSSKKKQGGEAMDALKKQHQLVQIVPEDGSLQADFGLLLLKAGKPEKAVHAFQRQAELGHDTARACYNLACAQALSGEKKAALASLEKSVKLGMSYSGVVDDKDLASLHGDPTFEKLQVALCAGENVKKKVKAALAAGEYDSAMNGLAKIADCPTSPKDRVAWANFELGKLLLDADRAEDSIKSFHRAMNAGYALDQGAFQLAASYAALGDQKQAMSHLHHALDFGFADPGELEKMMQDWALGRDGSMAELVDRAKVQASMIKKKVKKSGLKEAELKKKHISEKKVGKEIASVD